MKRVLVLTAFMGWFIGMHAQTFFGVASYYGPGFHGKMTASGEVYSQNKLTAAHKTLPLGTIIKVTNAQNNRSVYCRVNDRGPYVKGREIDVSSKAAEILGFRSKGKAYVKIEVVKLDSVPAEFVTAHPDLSQINGIELKDSTTVIQEKSTTNVKDTVAVVETSKTDISQIPENQTPKPPKEVKEANVNGLPSRPYFVIANLDKNTTGYYGVQLGVFSDPTIVFAMIAELQAKYKQAMVVQTAEIDNKTVYKLFIGKYQNRAYADALKSVLGDKFNDSFVVKYE